MRFEEEYRGNQQFISCKLKAEEVLAFELLLLQYNSFPMLLSPGIQVSGEEVILSYEITDLKRGMSQNKEKKKEYVMQIQKMAEYFRDYCLEMEGILINEESCFYSETEKQWKFLYLPLRQKENNGNISFLQDLFQEDPRKYLQLEMMKENRELVFRDYLQAVLAKEGDF